LLSKSGELVGFGSEDYKLIRGLPDNEKSVGEPKCNKTRFPYQPVQGGRDPTGEWEPGVKIKIGIAVKTTAIPALLIILNVPGFHGRLVIAFQPLKTPVSVTRIAKQILSQIQPVVVFGGQTT